MEKHCIFKQIGGSQETQEFEWADIQIWGSSELLQLLLEYDLVDELHLRIYPVILGEGKKLFKDGKIVTVFYYELTEKPGHNRRQLRYLEACAKWGKLVPSNGSTSMKNSAITAKQRKPSKR